MEPYRERMQEKRTKSDRQFHDSFVELASVVMGKGVLSNLLDETERTIAGALDEILHFLGIKWKKEGSEAESDEETLLESALHDSGTMYRPVALKGTWYQDAAGAYLGRTKTGRAVALLPSPAGGYCYFDYERKKKITVNARTAKLLEENAIYFYRSLPIKSLNVKDLLLFLLKHITAKDLVMVIGVTLLVTVMGMLSPYVINQIFAKVIPSGQMSLLIPVTTLAVGVLISTTIVNVSKSLIGNRVECYMDLSVEAAAMSRLISLPPGFFKNYSPGELMSRIKNIGQLCTMLYQMVFSTSLTALFSLVYVGQITKYAAALVVPAVIIILVNLIFSILFSLWNIRISRLRIERQAKLSGLTYSLFSGVEKIRQTGAEKSAFTKWAKNYKQTAELTYDPPLLMKLYPAFSGLIAMAGTLALYYFSVRAQISVSDYMTFNVCYGMVSGSFGAVAGLLMSFAQIRPVLEMAKPILSTAPEVQTGKRMVQTLGGEIEFADVSFRYDAENNSETMPLVLDHFSLKINAGDYIGITGRSGCGKSTFLRLILGFETPERGAIYFDGDNISTLDLQSLRRRMGVVLQDGKLFPGTIFENISLFTPSLDMNAAWEAAKIARIADDIRNMPMQMNTVITEGTGGISGGQKQRLLIARAIAADPRILIFDEATSALDNVTQNSVFKALGEKACTRIVIAHRLATLTECDRIIVIDGGRIAEDGTYDELMNKKGFFTELVEHQLL